VDKKIDHQHQIVYEVLQKEDAGKAAQIIASAFTDVNRGEPTTKRLNVTLEEFKAYVKPFCLRGANDELSVVAKNKEGELIGVLIAFDFSLPSPSPTYFRKNRIY